MIGVSKFATFNYMAILSRIMFGTLLLLTTAVLLREYQLRRPSKSTVGP
jgi:hypothetical protein